MKVRLVLEYDGTNFAGWQRQDHQPHIKTIQGELESSLKTFIASEHKKSGSPADLIEQLAAPSVQGSGRTDSGVHARAQVASFTWPETITFDQARLLKALNGIVSKGIGIISCNEVGDEFDARFTVHNKQYSYRIVNRDSSFGLDERRALIVRDRLNVTAMIRAARLLKGQHDFAAFRAVDCAAKTSVRTLHLSEVVRVNSDEIHYIVQGNGFLKQMVRIIVGTLIDVGREKITAQNFADVLAAKDRTRAGETAPAWGLYMDWVRYE